MKKTLLKILGVALSITFIGFIMDGDPKEPSMAVRFGEFFAMLVTIFILTSIVYYIASFTFKKIRSLTT